MKKHEMKRKRTGIAMKSKSLWLIPIIALAGITTAVLALSASHSGRAEELINRLESDLANSNQLTYGTIMNEYGKAAGAYIWKIEGERYAMTVFQFGDSYFKFLKRVEYREVIAVEVVHGYRTAPSLDYRVYVYDQERYQQILESQAFVRSIETD